MMETINDLHFIYIYFDFSENCGLGAVFKDNMFISTNSLKLMPLLFQQLFAISSAKL